MGKRTRVEVEVQQDASTAPFVAYFPTGNPSSDAAGKDLAFEVYEGNGSLGKGLLVGSKGNVDYVGKTAGDEYTGPNPCTYAVGVYDKESGKLRLMPVHWGKVIRLEAKLRNLKYGPTGAGSEYEAAETHEARRAENKRLVDSFGSTRRRRQLVSVEEGRIKAERLSATDHLTDIITKGAEEAALAGYTKAEVIKKALQIKNLPPHHPEAITAEQAYRLDEIIPAGCAVHLDVAKLFKASEDEGTLAALQKNGEVSPYVISRIPLLTIENRNVAKRRARALGLLAALLKLLHAKPILSSNIAQGHEGSEVLSKQTRIRPELVEPLLDLFYISRREGNKIKYERPSSKQELMIAYIMVVAALVEVDADGRAVIGPSQFESLRLELKLTSPEVVSRFREIGAKVSQVFQQTEDGRQRAYSASLLSDRSQVMSLGDSFPGLKLGRGKA